MRRFNSVAYRRDTEAVHAAQSSFYKNTTLTDLKTPTDGQSNCMLCVRISYFTKKKKKKLLLLSYRLHLMR